MGKCHIVTPLFALINQIHLERIQPALVVINKALALFVEGKISVFRVQTSRDQSEIAEIIECLVYPVVIPFGWSLGEMCSTELLAVSLNFLQRSVWRFF